MKTVHSVFLGGVTTVLGLHGGTFSYDQGPIPPGVGPAVPYVASGEYGDDLKWSMGGSGAPLAFTFAYHANYDLPGGMIVRLYDQDGPRVGGMPSPGTALWADVVDVRNGGWEVTVPLGEDFWAKAPPQLVFTVDFGQGTGGRVAGLYAAGGPVAEAYRDARFWQKDYPVSGGWGLVKFEGLTTAAAEFVATVRVVHLPEPSTWALAGVGAAALCMAGWRGKRKPAGYAHESGTSGPPGTG